MTATTGIGTSDTGETSPLYTPFSVRSSRYVFPCRTPSSDSNPPCPSADHRASPRNKSASRPCIPCHCKCLQTETVRDLANQSIENIVAFYCLCRN